MLHTLLTIWAFFHPYYVSVTEITHNAKQKSLEISSRIFYNDLEAALEKKYQTKVDILNVQDKKKTDPLVADYIQHYLNVKIDNKPLTLHYLGYEIEGDGIWCYFEVKNIQKVRKVEVNDAILFAEHPEQINMLHVTVAGKRKSRKLDNPESKADFIF